MRKEKSCSSTKERNISRRHSVPSFFATEPHSCSQVDLMWFLFDFRGCCWFSISKLFLCPVDSETGWVSQVMTPKWETRSSPLSNADLAWIRGTPGRFHLSYSRGTHDSQVRVIFDSTRAVWFAALSVGVFRICQHWELQHSTLVALL